VVDAEIIEDPKPSEAETPVQLQTFAELPHMLRHSWAHMLKQAGAGEGDLMALGGWSTSPMAASRSVGSSRASS